MPAEKVVIVGGGFTGLTAARELARSGAGLEITVLERAPVLGGLAAGFPVCGTSLEKTYHYLFLSDSDILELLRELGLEDRLIWGQSTVGVYLGGRVHPFTTALDVLRFSPCGLLGRLRLGLAVFYLQKKKNWRGLVGQTARQWMARACGPGPMRTVWDPLLQGKFDRYREEVSMAWLWARIHTRVNSRAAGGEKLGYIRGGFAVLTRKMEEELREAGVKLRVNACVERLELSGGRRALAVNGETIPFDRCLFSGPSYALARLLPADPALTGYTRQLESIAYLGAICLVFVSEQSIADQSWVNVHEEGAPFLLIVQHTRLVGPELYQGKHVYYLGSYQPQDSPLFAMSDETLEATWLDYLRKVYPHFDPRKVSEKHVFKFSAAQHIVDTDYEKKIPAYRTPVPGIYLANFSQIFPEDRGTNYAVRDGKKIARLMLEDLGTARHRPAGK